MAFLGASAPFGIPRHPLCPLGGFRRSGASYSPDCAEQGQGVGTTPLCLSSKPLYHSSLSFSEVFESRPLSPFPPNTFACSLRRKIT